MSDMKMLNPEDQVQEHSKLKIKLYEKVLEGHLPVLLLSKSIRNVIVCEPFAGPGRYDDGTEGSPVVARNTIEKVKNHPTVKKIEGQKQVKLYLNEGVKKFAEKLSAEINDSESVKIVNNKADDFLRKCLQHREFISAYNQKFFFIDPFGYSESSVADYSILSDIFHLPQSESMFFIPVSHIQRFISGESKQGEPARKFLEWRGIRQSYKSPREISNEIVESFRKDGFFCYDFELSAGSNKYYIYYIGQHMYGADKFIAAKDKVIISEREEKDKYSLFLEMEKEIYYDWMIQEFIKILTPFIIEFRTNKEIYDFAIRNGFSSKVANEALKMCKNDITVDLLIDKAKKHCFYVNWCNFKNSQPAKIRIKWKGKNE